MTRRPDRAADLDLALDAVLEAGDAIMPSFRADPAVRHKAPDQPVTDADLTADAILGRRLREDRPGYGWLSEESADRPDRLSLDRVWVVDPIDGTRSFIAGYREFAISVALSDGGRAVVGVVYNPARDEVYWAVQGGGAYRARHWRGGRSEDEPLRCRPDRTARPGLLASRSEIGRGELTAFEAGWRVTPLGSTAYKLAGVAAGVGQAFISRGPKSEWDVAAGALLVEEAGGTVTDVAGRPLEYNRPDPYVHGIVAAEAGLHGRLLEEARGMASPRLRDAGRPEVEG